MEDFYIQKMVIIKGLKAGYQSLQDRKDLEYIDMKEGKWVFPDGKQLGSTWDIILSPAFAKLFWSEETHQEHLMEMVVLSSGERIEYLQDYLTEHDFIEEKSPEDAPANIQLPDFKADPTKDGLMHEIEKSLQRLKDYSEGLFIDSCNNTYNDLKPILDKDSVTELSEYDFYILNANNKTMGGALSRYLDDIGKSSFALCPECGQDGLSHSRGCSVDRKSGEWLIANNDGC